jgi:hypothetical protein
MAQLVIKNLIPLATMVIAVEFAPAAVAPDHYLVTADDGTMQITSQGHSSVVHVGPLRVRASYSFTVAAVYAVDPPVVGAPLVRSFDPPVSRAMILRQKIADIARVAALPGITLVCDRYGVPKFLGKHDGFTSGNVMLEVGHPRLINGQMNASGSRNVDLWQIDLDFIDFTDDEDLGVDKCSIAFERLRPTVNSVPNLKLLGVIDKSWTWITDGHLPQLEDGVLSYPTRLQIPVQSLAGKLPYES